MLACRSPELFVAQAWEFTRSGIVNSGDCAAVSSRPNPRAEPIAPGKPACLSLFNSPLRVRR